MSETDLKEEVTTTRVIEPSPSRMTKFQRSTAVSQTNIAAIEDDIYDTSFRVIKEVLDFRDVNPALEPDEVDPVLEQWIAEMGVEEATKRYRLAMAGWNKPADMPAGVKLAQETFVGITKARSKQPVQHVQINAQFVTLAPPVEYPELIEESEE